LSGAALLLVAPAIGSFLGVIIRRLPEDRPIVWSRSRCEACGSVLTARDLVPLVSWLMLGGRCRSCGHRLGWFYPGGELAALLVAVTALVIDDPSRAWLDCLVGWWLLLLGWIDLRSWVLPDLLTLPLLLAGLIEAAAFQPEGLFERALGAAVGYLALRAVAMTYRAVRGREGLGGGDAKLLGAAGAWLGVMALPEVILAAALAALVAAGALRLAGIRLHAHSALPFGPFIALSTWAYWLCGTVFAPGP
jgi:leader peptidase (prepilin peptidase)/N-methyltransferase